jgi:lysophospholipase L1-like esterase
MLVSYYTGTNGVAPDPVSLGWTKSGTGGTVGGVSPDGATGLNAWNVNDNTTGAIGQAYNTNLTAAQHAIVTTNGWEFRVKLRMTNGYSAGGSMYLQYNNGSARWLYFVDVTTGGALTVQTFSPAQTLTVQPVHDGAYHEFVLTKFVTNSSATLRMDGNLVTTIGTFSAGGLAGISFGAGSTGGDGSANFHNVQFTSLPPATNSIPTNPPPITLKLARVFASHAVFQRDQPFPVFGEDVPGTAITVSFDGQMLNTVADTNGNWRVNLAPLALNSSPQTLAVTGSANVICTNILVGDVWLISGQSNASFPLSSATGGATAAAGATNSLLRYWWMNEQPVTDNIVWSATDVAKLNPDDYFSGTWQVSSAATAGSISAVGYFFARHILTNQNIPVGLIDCSVGGTMAQNWMPTAATTADPRLKSVADHFLDSDMVTAFVKSRTLKNLSDWNTAGRPAPMPEHPYQPGACWRNGFANIVPFALRGVLWYQGESDADFYDPFDYDLMARWHKDVFTKLVAAWRSAWENPSLPVYSVQLPQMNRPSWPWFRESQLKCALTISNSAMAVAFEFGNPGDVHPVNKQPVGDRLALIARALSYGQNIEWSGPQLISTVLSNGAMVLKFSHTTGGLVSSDGLALKQFTIAGTNRVFYAATASISDDSLIVSAPQVPQPVAVRYAWIQSGAINFYNGAGLPASPFRTDRWTTTNRPVRVACIGDSITFGLGISDTNQTYPARLQALLGPEFDVRNFGKSGCTVTRDSVSTWARGYIKQAEHTNALAFQPDVVICNLGINDVSTFVNAHRTNLVRDYREIIAAYRALPTAPRIIIWQRLAPLFPGQTYYGQPVVTEVSDLIRTVADQTGADAVDLTPPLVDHPEWFPDKIHPNADGAQRIADVIYGWLLQWFEIPPGTKLSKLDANRLGAGQFVVSFPAWANVAYQLQSSSDLESWEDGQFLPASSLPETLACTNPMTDAARFFRLRLDLD